MTKKTSVKKDRIYKCQYCEDRMTRVDLVHHLNEEHEDMIPENYTASRLVFNHINKKESGKCIVCSKKTTWNEEVWRYNRLCSDKCHKEYVKVVKSRMVNKYGKEHILDDPEHQKKMLKNRRISGTYKFTDGGIREYCGTYERKLLEFYDKVLNVSSKDIMTPGPIVEYDYNGKKLKWITDLYYVPANLVHDVKDGGENPNNRQMDDYRAKQIAKEKSIEKLDKYNYIRLTDNNFQQLLLILAELKELMMDNKEEFITRVNESSATAGVMANTNDVDNVYIVPCMMNNTFVKTVLTTDKYLNDIYEVKDGKCKKTNRESIKEYDISLYRFKGKNIQEKFNNILAECESPSEEYLDDDYFYRTLTNKEVLSQDQYKYDELFEYDIDAITEMRIKSSIIESSIKHQVNSLTNSNMYIDILNIQESSKINDMCKEFNNITIMSDMDGYFGYNHITECRTMSFTNIDYLYNSIEGINTLRVLDKFKI